MTSATTALRWFVAVGVVAALSACQTTSARDSAALPEAYHADRNGDLITVSARVRGGTDDFEAVRCAAAGLARPGETAAVIGRVETEVFTRSGVRLIAADVVMRDDAQQGPDIFSLERAEEACRAIGRDPDEAYAPIPSGGLQGGSPFEPSYRAMG